MRARERQTDIERELRQQRGVAVTEGTRAGGEAPEKDDPPERDSRKQFLRHGRKDLGLASALDQTGQSLNSTWANGALPMRLNCKSLGRSLPSTCRSDKRIMSGTGTPSLGRACTEAAAKASSPCCSSLENGAAPPGEHVRSDLFVDSNCIGQGHRNIPRPYERR